MTVYLSQTDLTLTVLTLVTVWSIFSRASVLPHSIQCFAFSVCFQTPVCFSFSFMQFVLGDSRCSTNHNNWQVTMKQVWKKPKPLNYLCFYWYFQLFCRNLPSTVTIKLVKKLECYDYEAVPYDVFRSSVFTCCVLRGTVVHLTNCLCVCVRHRL